MADDGWVPAFPGQRPPFAPGNTASVTSGYRSERTVAPLAAQILDELLADPATPPYLLADRSYGPALAAWSRAEAIVHLLTAYVTDVGLPKALAGRGFLVETLRKWETTAMNHRRRLGLDPESRAKIVRDLSAARYMTGSDALSMVLDRVADERAAIEAGDGRDDV